MARTNTDKLKLPKHDTGDLNWGGDFNEGLEALDEHVQRETLRPPRTLTAQLGSGAVGAYLLGNTSYYYKVTAINGAGETTEGKIPAVLEALVTQGATPVPVLLEWEAVAGATGYRIYKAASTGAEKFLVEKSGGSTVTHTDDGNTDTTTTDVPGSNTARASVTGIRKTGEANPLRGDVKLKPGSGITLTQLPGTNELEIASPADVLTHALGGAAHTADTLANLNAKISDATLVDQAAVILQALADAKGDLIVASGADAFARLAVGADGKFLKANTGAAYGVEWADPPGGGSETVVVAAPTGTPATDTANIQNAINALGAGGGTVVLLDGTYVLNAAINLPSGKPVWLRGQGEATVVALDATFAGTSPVGVFKSPGSGAMDDLRITDMVLDASSDPRKARWIRLLAPSGVTYTNITIARVKFIDHKVAVDLYASGTASMNGVRVERCRFRGCDRGISALVDNGKRYFFAYNDFDVSADPASMGSAFLVGSTGVSEVVIKGNQINYPHSTQDNYSCISFSFAPVRVVVANNVLTGRPGIYLASGSSLVDAIISGNTFNTTGGTESIRNLGGFTNCVLSGNRANQQFTVAGGSGNLYIGNKATLTLSDTSPVIINENPINQSLLTTQGDLAVRGASVAERLAKGTDGQVLTMVTGAPAWADAAGGGGGYATVVVDAPTGNAATDTSAVNTAIAAIGSAGGTVIFREGTYVLNSITPGKDKIRFQGQGAEATVLQHNGSNMWEIANRSDLEWCDMQFYMSGGGRFFNAASGLMFRCKWLRCTFKVESTGESRCFFNGSFQKENFRIEDCQFLFSGSGDMYVLSTGTWGYLSFCRNLIDYSGSTGADPSAWGGALMGSFNDSVIADNRCIGGKFEFFLMTDANRTVIANNVIRKDSDSGANFNSNHALLFSGGSDNTIVGNYIVVNTTTAGDNGGSCIYLGNIGGFTITGNKLVPQNSAKGIWMGRLSNNTSNMAITGNNAGTIQIDSGAGSTGNVIVGNKATVTDNSGGTNTVASNG